MLKPITLCLTAALLLCAASDASAAHLTGQAGGEAKFSGKSDMKAKPPQKHAPAPMPTSEPTPEPIAEPAHSAPVAEPVKAAAPAPEPEPAAEPVKESAQEAVQEAPAEATATETAHVTDAQADLALGAETFIGCSGCHGEAAEGIVDMGPRLNGQPAWYLKRQVIKFKNGFRGYNEDEDFSGPMMRAAAEPLSDQEIVSVIAHIAKMPATDPEPTLEGGDLEAGKALWEANCTFCHGIDGKGNESLGAPRLAGQSDWYLVKQLNYFRQGLRGTHKSDDLGQQMQSMATILADDQAVLDVATYINSMR